jgi:hypothetical protein
MKGARRFENPPRRRDAFGTRSAGAKGLVMDDTVEQRR